MIAATIVMLMIPNEKKMPQGSGNKKDSRSHFLPAPQEIITVREAWSIARFKLILLTAFAQGWTNMGVRLAIVPLLAEAIIGAPVWLAGSLLTAFALGNCFSLLTAGRWSDIYGRRRLAVSYTHLTLPTICSV